MKVARRTTGFTVYIVCAKKILLRTAFEPLRREVTRAAEKTGWKRKKEELR